MAKKLEQEIGDLIANGSATEVEGNSFGTSVRNIHQDPMDVDDEFTIPADYKVLSAPIVAGGDPVKFILVTMTNAKTGISRNMRFFPNQLAKSIYPLVNGRLQSKVKTVGTAAEQYQSFADKQDSSIDAAVKSLVGKKIKITAKTPYTIYAYGTTNEVISNIYTYDFA